MTDQEILDIIAQGIVDGTDLDCTAETQAREVLRQLRAAGVLPQWQPIETAPKKKSPRARKFESGPLILLASTFGHIAVGYWGLGRRNTEKCWCNVHDHMPMEYWNAFTHWMPIPMQPEAPQ